MSLYHSTVYDNRFLEKQLLLTRQQIPMSCLLTLGIYINITEGYHIITTCDKFYIAKVTDSNQNAHRRLDGLSLITK